MAGNRTRNQGQLEALVLNALWDAGNEASSKVIRTKLDSDVALTTLLTVLSRLTDKGLVEKVNGGGRSLAFRAVVTKEQFAANQLLKIVSESGDPALAFAHFAKGLDSAALQALRDSLG